MPEAEQARYAPETLVGHQVVATDGTLYEDDPDSPVVLLGDSFTGVYELMDCEHAGVSAHLAKELGTPIDLVMSYGGGPNVRAKLLRRGEAALGTKKVVIWMMTARDLYDFCRRVGTVRAPRRRWPRRRCCGGRAGAVAVGCSRRRELAPPGPGRERAGGARRRAGIRAVGRRGRLA